MRRALILRLLVLGVLVLGAGRAVADYAFTDIVDAARRGDGHAVHKLLEQDAESVRAVDARGFTALHWAGIRGHWRIFRELLSASADVNAVGGDGGTPLHWACHHDRADMVELLLEAGAEVGMSNRWGRTPLHVAARRGCADVARLLLSRDADPNAGTREGWTPLHVANRSGHPEMVALLEASGADRELRDAEGLRPADNATVRPPRIEIAEETFDEYVGIYDLGGGFTVKVWRKGEGLAIREFAPDGLYPIGEDLFHCVQEPWKVRFVRDEGGAVASVELQFLRRTVTGSRTLSPRYVGSRACRTCHDGAEAGHQYVRWMRSRHGHAFWHLGTDWALYLAKLRPHYHDLEMPMEDERCQLCHVTGAQVDSALFAATFRREEGVGCEVCHGPGSEYIDPEVMGGRESFLEHGGIVPDERTCSSCHRNSERFDFATWWPKIAHPRPATAAEGSD